MKAAYIEKWGEMSLKDIEIPKITHGEALVKVKYAGICGTDLHVFNGHHPTAVLPLILGHFNVFRFAFGREPVHVHALVKSEPGVIPAHFKIVCKRV